MQTFVECTKTYLGTHRIVQGTKAEVEANVGPVVRLKITEPREGGELQIGEVHDVSMSDYQQFWRVTSEIVGPTLDWNNDRGKVRQRHPADPT